MMKSMKALLSCILAAVLMVGAGSMSAFAEPGGSSHVEQAVEASNEPADTSRLQELIGAKYHYEGGSYDSVVAEGAPPSHSDYESCAKGNTTAVSWSAYEAALKDARSLVSELYGPDGAPTEANTAERQAEVDALAQRLEAAAKGLVKQSDYDVQLGFFKDNREDSLKALSDLDPSRLSADDYEPGTWKEFADAYALLEDVCGHDFAGGTRDDLDALIRFSDPRYHEGLGFLDGVSGNTPAETQQAIYMAGWKSHCANWYLREKYRSLRVMRDIAVSVRYSNHMATRHAWLRDKGTDVASATVALGSGNTTLRDAIDAAGIVFDAQRSILSFPDGIVSDYDVETVWLETFVNGEYRGIVGYADGEADAAGKLCLKDGDEVVISRVARPLFLIEASTGETSTANYLYPAAERLYADSVSAVSIDGVTKDAKVGDEVAVSASVTDMLGAGKGSKASAEGLTLFVSKASADDALAPPSIETAKKTDADGSVSCYFNEAGWYTIALFDLRADEFAFENVYGTLADGWYHSLCAGDFVKVRVSDPDDEQAVVKRYREAFLEEAGAFVQRYHDYDFAPGYYEKTLRADYDALVSHLESATGFKAMDEQYRADLGKLKEDAKCALDHDAIIGKLRDDLALIPADEARLNEDHKDLVQGVQNAYKGLNEFQRGMLTAAELKRLDGVAKLDASSFRKFARVTVRFAVDGELPYGSDENGTGGNVWMGWPDVTWVSHPGLDGEFPAPNFVTMERSVGDVSVEAKAGDRVSARRYLGGNTTTKRYWMMWSSDGGKTWNASENVAYGEYGGYFIAEYAVPSGIEDGSTVDVTLKMFTKSEYASFVEKRDASVCGDAKKAATAAIDNYYSGFKRTPAVEAAYKDGIASIAAAKTVGSVLSARRDAARAISNAAGGRGGTVTVIVENATYPKKDGAPWEGELVHDEVALDEDSTMMSCIAKALDDAGYDCEGAESNYISSINGLAHFDGGPASGWMGTLNDWFTNEGFAAFTVKKGSLQPGDTIRVMYTVNGYGQDLGGTWGSSDTSLKSLKVIDCSGHETKMPVSESGRVFYVKESEAAGHLTVVPEAANKNYQVRTYLNEKVVSNAMGGSFYRYQEDVPVTAGDVIYVGVGEHAWPSMNNQGAEATSYAGTWYEIRIVADGSNPEGGTDPDPGAEPEPGAKPDPGSAASPKDLSGASVSLSRATYAYNGQKRTPAVTVKLGGAVLVKDRDYSVGYSSNVNAGKALVTVTGKGAYKGTATKSFSIVRAPQSKAKVATSKVKAKGVKAKKLKKAKSFKLKASGVLGGAKIAWKKASVPKAAKKFISLSKGGKLTVKKGLKKGTYKVKVKLVVGATANYEGKTISKTIKVVVK